MHVITKSIFQVVENGGTLKSANERFILDKDVNKKLSQVLIAYGIFRGIAFIAES